MKRRDLAKSVAALPFAGLLRPAQAMTGPDARVADKSPQWRCFELTVNVTLADAPGAAQLFLPLTQTAGDYQITSSTVVRGGGDSRIVSDARYGAAMLQTIWDGRSSDPKSVQLVQVVNTRDRTGADPM